MTSCICRKGQVAPLMVVVIAMLILAIAATMIIGESTFNQIRLNNTADNAMISGITSFCRGLNQIRQISIGSGGLLVTYVGVQVHLLTYPGPPFGVWHFKGQPLLSGFYISSVLTSRRLFEQARRLGGSLPKDLRIEVYEGALGAALTDEPKPAIDTGDCFTSIADPVTGGLKEIPVACSDGRDEVIKDRQGRVVGIEQARYNQRPYYFAQLLRAFKSGEEKEDPAHPGSNIGSEFVDNPHAGPENPKNPGSGWYNNNYISYSFTKTAGDLSSCPGQMVFTSPASDVIGPISRCPDKPAEAQDYPAYSSYFSSGLTNTPTSVDVQAQKMILIYFYKIPKPPFVMIGVIPYPWAWIKRIVINYPLGGSNISAMTLKKKDTFGTTILFFGRKPIVTRHTTYMRIKGSVWSGFEPVMDAPPGG